MDTTLFHKQMITQLATLHIDMDIAELTGAFRQRTFKKGEHLIREGTIENKVLYICRGLLRYYYITIDGEDITKHFALEDDFSSSYASLIYNRPSAYNIVAEENTDALVIDATVYRQKVRTSPLWERMARLYTENIYNLKELREADLLTLNATERYTNFLKQYPNVNGRLKQKHIATYLGIHPVTLSRIKKQRNC